MAAKDVFSMDTGAALESSNVSINDTRRMFNFGERIAELAPQQSPFFVYLSKVAKKATDDPVFKFTEKRSSFHKRYAYPSAFSNDNSTWVEDQSTNATTQYDKYETAGNTVSI